MKKLIQTIQQLNAVDFSEFKNTLEKTKSDKFLNLTVAYRDNKLDNEQLQKKLDCNENALYVLKSRLYDKIQRYLIDKSPNQINTQCGEIHPDYCNYLFDYPRETAIAMLHELEQTFLINDKTIELISIYSMLKKVYAYSEKNYHYSQLYNKQISCLLVHEKAEDLLLNFNKTLANYYFSNSDTDQEKLNLIKKEAKNIYALSKSKRIELIVNTIIVQIGLFTKIDVKDEEPIEDLLNTNVSIVNSYPVDLEISKFKMVNDFLLSEYYLKINQTKKAGSYLNKISEVSHNWLLMNNTCLSFKFLLSKIEFALELGKEEDLLQEFENMNFDRSDFYTSVMHNFCIGIALYYNKKAKESISHLNKLLNEISLINFFFIELEIKLSLAYIYYTQNDYEQADNLLKSLIRKLNSDKKTNINNAKLIIKILTIKMSLTNTDVMNLKLQTAFEQLEYYNSKERTLLIYFMKEINSEPTPL